MFPWIEHLRGAAGNHILDESFGSYLGKICNSVEDKTNFVKMTHLQCSAGATKVVAYNCVAYHCFNSYYNGISCRM